MHAEIFMALHQLCVHIFFKANTREKKESKDNDGDGKKSVAAEQEGKKKVLRCSKKVEHKKRRYKNEK
jgi:hypothetical protein